MRKYICIIFMMHFISGCYTPKLYTIYPVKALLGIDFFPFTEKGFLFTPEKYAGQYEAIGLINYETIPGAQYELIPESPNPQYIPGGTHQPRYISTHKWQVDSISLKKAMEEVYEICVNMGADALVNFNSERISVPYENITNPVVISGYRITGFAIKRK